MTSYVCFYLGPLGKPKWLCKTIALSVLYIYDQKTAQDEDLLEESDAGDCGNVSGV